MYTLNKLSLSLSGKFKLIFQYLKYLAISGYSGGHGIHSPFLFDFFENVLFLKNDNSNYSKTEEYIKFLKNANTILTIDDFGAGSKKSNTVDRKISTIFRHSSTSKKYGRVIARMVSYFKPECIVELGTSLGVGTAYLATNMLPDTKLYTIEGSKSLLNFTIKNNKNFRIEKIFPLNGNFDLVLPELLKQIETVDMVYIDGNHREKPTIAYFEWLLPKLQNNSVLVFDDIHWSDEMEQAWNYIKSHKLVTLSLDLFQLGIVFFRKELIKEHYIIRY